MLPGGNGSEHAPTSVGSHAAEPDPRTGVGQLAGLVGKEPIAKCGNETGGGLLTSVRCEMTSSSQSNLPSLKITM